MNILGLDIGGTKTSVCLGDERGQIRAARRRPTRTDEGVPAWFERTLAQIAEALDEARVSPAQLDAIGCSCPGPMSTKKGILLASPNMPGWTDVPIQQMLYDKFRRPVHINNDANTCALAEWMWGAAAGADPLVYLTMSTGLGAGVIANGQLLQGASDLAGEVGHHVQDLNGPPCPCGQRGCWELFCGGKNVADRLRAEITGANVRTAILDEAGGDPERIDFAAFARAVRKRDAFAQERWDEYLERLAQGFGAVIQFYNPEVILLGTIGIRAADLIFPELHRRLPRYAWSWGRAACRIEPSSLAEKIGDLSALAVAAQALR